MCASMSDLEEGDDQTRDENGKRARDGLGRMRLRVLDFDFTDCNCWFDLVAVDLEFQIYENENCK